MRKKRKIKITFTALILAAGMLLLSACGGKQAPDDGGQSGINTGNTGGALEGLWIEKNISPSEDEDMFFSFLNADGSLSCFDKSFSKRWDSSDNGDTWQQSEGPCANVEVEGFPRYCALLDNGDIIACLYEMGESADYKLVRIKPDGTIEDFIIDELENNMEEGFTQSITSFCALPGNRLFIGYSNVDYGPMGGDFAAGGLDDIDGGEDAAAPDAADDTEDDKNEDEDNDDDGSFGFASGMGSSGYFLYDVENNALIKNINTEYIADICSDNEFFYLSSYNGQVDVYSIETGELHHSAEELPQTDFTAFTKMSAGANGLVYSSGSAIYSNKDNSGWQQEFLLTGYAAGRYGTFIDNLHLLENGAVVANISAINEAGKLYRYDYDKDARINEEDILRIWSLNDDAKIRGAISEFCEKNPDKRVEYEIGLSSESAMTADDAIKKLNTRIVTGDVPDIIVLDGCPIESYVDKGALKDLSGLIDKSGIYENLLAGVEKNGELYYVPAGMKIPVIFGSGSELDNAASLEKLVEFIESKPEKPVLNLSNEDPFAGVDESERAAIGFESLDELFDILWKCSAGEIINNNTLNKEALEQFLSTVKTVADKYSLLEDGEEGGGMMVSVVTGDGGSAASISGAAINYMSGQSLLGSMVLDNFLGLDMLGSDITLKSFPGLNSGAWLPESIVAISAESKKDALAAEFINCLLSPEVQSRRIANLPVTKAGADKMLDDLSNMYTFDPQDDEPYNIDYDSLLSLLKQPVFEEEILTGMVYEGVCAYVLDGTELNKAVEDIEKNLKKYLAERN